MAMIHRERLLLEFPGIMPPDSLVLGGFGSEPP
jgi:hypothetical protein